jgi:serine/threonine protein kinase
MSELTAFDLPLRPAEDTRYVPGQVLADRYELSHVVGSGGTAVVWVARDAVLDIDVAVKIVLPSRDDAASGLGERTIQEARLCAQLTDPAVCRVLDFGFTGRGDPFVVSELLSGETLDDRLLREERLAPVEAVRLLLPILDALGAAHKKGIVHRDVKPANVFLARFDGRIQPKLLDFGIACSPGIRSRVTAAGTICGTPCYMSPEQARGSADIDHRSDLWSFCVMLYELVTGTAPFFNENCNATLFAIASQIPPSIVSFGCDAALAPIVERGMQKDRDARFQSAAELADALSRWLLNQGFESDICGISLRRRLLEPFSVAVPVLLRDDLASQRPVEFVPPPRSGWGGALALFSVLAVAVGVVTAVAWARQSTPFARSNLRPAAAAAPVVRPPPAPPLPIYEGVGTQVATTSPPREKSVHVPARAPAPRVAKAAPARPSPSASVPSRLSLPELPSFPPLSPFSSSGRSPAVVEEQIPASDTPSPAGSTSSSVRKGKVPVRDFGI